MKVSAFLLLAMAAPAAAFQSTLPPRPSFTEMSMSKENKKANDFLDSAAAVVETTAASSSPTEDEDDSLTKVAESAMGLGKLFSDIGTSVAGQVAAEWDKKRLNTLQKARLSDMLAELNELNDQWDQTTLEQREGLLEEGFTTTFKLLQTVQNQQDGNGEVMSEDIKDLEALATQRIVLKKTEGEVTP